MMKGNMQNRRLLLMKTLLKIALILMLALPCAAMAEETAIVYFHDGSMVMIPAEIANDPEKLSAYCNTYFPGRGYSFDMSAGDYDAVLSDVWTKAQYGENSMAAGVKLVKLGLNKSEVTLQGETLIVPTQHLTFGENDDAEHRIGVVYAPRSGEASLREEEGGSAKVIQQVKTGRIAAILAYNGGTFTKILYDGVEGYIRTDCLIFHSGEEVPVGTGVLHVKGDTDGEKNVTIRTAMSTSQAKVTALPTGTVVTVYGQEDDWYAVEYGGWFGYVQEQYLEME